MKKTTFIYPLLLSITFFLTNTAAIGASKDGTLEVTGSVALATNSGQVGIGTTKPNALLEITAAKQPVHLSLNAQDKEAGGKILFQTLDKTDYQIVSDKASNSFVLKASNGNAFFKHNRESNHMTIGYKGNVGIDVQNPVEKLDVGGAVKCTSIIEFADSRYKRNIQPINHPLDKVMQLRGVEWSWKKNGLSSNQKKQYGVVAQEVEEVLPELVYTARNGDKSVAYTKIIGLLIESIKEQQTHILELEERLAEVAEEKAVAEVEKEESPQPQL